MFRPCCRLFLWDNKIYSCLDGHNHKYFYVFRFIYGSKPKFFVAIYFYYIARHTLYT